MDFRFLFALVGVLCACSRTTRTGGEAAAPQFARVPATATTAPPHDRPVSGDAAGSDSGEPDTLDCRLTMTDVVRSRTRAIGSAPLRRRSRAGGKHSWKSSRCADGSRAHPDSLPRRWSSTFTAWTLSPASAERTESRSADIGCATRRRSVRSRFPRVRGSEPSMATGLLASFTAREDTSAASRSFTPRSPANCQPACSVSFGGSGPSAENPAGSKSCSRSTSL